MNLLKYKTVLYAEDEKQTKTLYAEHFKQIFKAVYLADNGQQALDIYYQEKPDLVILDIIMPQKSGLEVCEQIRSNDKQTKIIMLTSHTDKEALMLAIELGLTAYLEKPVTRAKLNESLQKVTQSFQDNSNIDLWFNQKQQWCWDILSRELFCGSQVVTLTKKEKSLLEFLINSKQRRLSYLQIYTHVWAEDYRKEFSEASVKTLIKGLRAKIPENSIKNVYGLGFYLNKV